MQCVTNFPFHLYFWFKRRRGLGLRLILCWLIGLFVFSNDEISGHDQRLQMRGEQAKNSGIAIVNLKPSDLKYFFDSRTHPLVTLGEVTDMTDGFYWEQKFWRHLLEQILKLKPKAIGVTLFLGENIGTVALTDEDKKIFLNPLVVWSSTINSMDRTLPPIFANNKNTNFGSHELKRDDDGVVRRVTHRKGDQPHLSEKLTGKTFNDSSESLLLNYRGSGLVFSSYTASQILNGEVPEDAFLNKIILIGAETNSGGKFITPLGSMNRAEILSHVVDNLSENRWIKKWPTAGYGLLLLVFTALAVFIIMSYPQSVVFVFYLGLALLISAISTWVFDTFYLWIPIYTPITILGTVWFIFVGYQASKIERTNFRLQQEQKNLFELEQLKNNFVSLISHDLKTPIAKIQAIVDRLRREPENSRIQRDLLNMENYSDELNRYIQSILSLLRVESRDFKVHKETADLNEIIEQALLQVGPLAQNKNIEIIKNLEPLFSLEFDMILIKEVLINLIENAINYSAPGQKIKIVSQEIDHGVKVSVEDNGEGIPAEEIPKIWGKFVRGADQTMKSKGSGLGLYLVKYFIELHGGQVSLTSQRGPAAAVPQGTIVSFTLPFEPQA